MSMDIRLSDRVDLELITETDDTRGGTTKAWAVPHDGEALPARVRRIAPGREVVDNQAVHQIATEEVIIRYRTDVVSDAQFVHNDRIGLRTLRMIGPPEDVDLKRRWLKCLCREVVK